MAEVENSRYESLRYYAHLILALMRQWLGNMRMMERFIKLSTSQSFFLYGPRGLGKSTLLKNLSPVVVGSGLAIHSSEGLNPNRE